ncbi:hypothetical protein C8J56DRAFT_893226 [Mycena floridula]|nr:hypothetical protein C8J56DRAFT_893226 [Mycena floridula]
MSNSTVIPLLTPQEETLVQQWVVGIAMCASLGYGMYLILGLQAIKRGIMNSRPRCVLLITMISMSVAITAVFVNNIGFALSDLALLSETQYSLRVYQHGAIMGMALMSDGIVVWRAWVICDQRWVKIALSCSMISASIGFIIECVIYSHRLLATGQTYETMSAVLPMLVSIMATNLVATVAVGHKAWIHHQTVRNSANQPLIRSKTHHVLMLLLESGLAYLVLWIIRTALWFSPSAALEYIYVDISVPYMLTSLPETPARHFLSHSLRNAAESRSTAWDIELNNEGVHKPEPKELSISAV